MGNLNVLLVDDDVVNLKLLEVMIKKTGFVNEVVKAENGLDALNILDMRDDINVIFLDIVMPVMNGLEFLDNLNSRAAGGSTIPVIVITTDETAKNESFNRGAYDFITKPVFDKDLTEKLEKIARLLSSN